MIDKKKGPAKGLSFYWFYGRSARYGCRTDSFGAWWHTFSGRATWKWRTLMENAMRRTYYDFDAHLITSIMWLPQTCSFISNSGGTSTVLP